MTDKAKETDGTMSKSNEVPHDEILTAKAAQLQGQPDSSCSSVKLKKSSNIFSALVKKARRKKGWSSKASNLSASSTQSVAVHIEEEVELSCENYDKKMMSQAQVMLWENRGVCSETNTSNHSDDSSTKSPRNIFSTRNAQSCSVIKDDPIKAKQSSKLLQRRQELASSQETIFSSFINFRKSKLDMTYADALHYLQEVINSFHDSENHLIGLLVQYITDQNVQEEMRDAISNHTKLQWEAERRSCSLASDIWMQQLEIGRTQERFLQSTLNSLVKQNRQLQVEIESIYRKYEKSCKLVRGYSLDHRNRYQGIFKECDSQVDSVLRHNEKLQTKLETLFKKIESLEGELSIFQKQNDNMEEQLRHSTVKLQNMKATFHKVKTDYEIELVALNFKLEAKKRILKEASSVKDTVLEDIDNLKRQLKTFPFALNWSKFKMNSGSLTELMHLCRSCMSELSQELLNIHNELKLKDKDVLSLREENKTLQENIKKSMSEMNIITKKIEASSSVIQEKEFLEQRCQELKNELTASKDKLEKLKEQYEEEKTGLLQNLDAHEKYLKELEEKEKIIEQNKSLMTNMSSQNFSLQNQIAELNNIIRETGAGDIIRQMEQKHEELDYFRTQLDMLRNENGLLKMQIERGQQENTAILSNQELAYQTVQRQIQEIEKLNEENQTLRQKVEAEHQTVISLQNERMKYLEDKGVLKSIVQHLKGEVSKVKELETNLSTISMEANKLELVANYHKQQGEKLKQELSERDATIKQLQTTMEKIKELQMQDAKEKLTLCHELHEVSHIKEKLSEVLHTEVKKNAELGQSKEAMVKSVSSQIQRIEEKHRNERTAIRILLKDIKTTADEKDSALKEKNKLQMEIDQLQSKLVDVERKYGNVTKDIAMQNAEIKEMKKEIDRLEKKSKEASQKLEDESSKYEQNTKQLKRLIQQLREDKKDLEDNNEYLKSNISRINKDLNASRQAEKTATNSLNQVKKELQEAKELLNEQVEIAKKIAAEKEKLSEEKYQLTSERNHLRKESQCLNALMDKVVNDFEQSLKFAEEKEKMFVKDLHEAKQIIYNYVNEMTDLKKSIELKESRLEELNDIKQLREEKIHFQEESEHLKENKLTLENELTELQEEYDKMSKYVKELEKSIKILETEMQHVIDQKQEDYVFYKQHIAEITRDKEETEEHVQTELTNLRHQLQDLANKLDNEKTAYETLSQIHKDVSAKFMRSIKDLVEVKNSKHDMMERIREEKMSIEYVQKENKDLRRRVTELTEKLESASVQIKHLSEEKAVLKTNYGSVLDKCNSLEKQIKEEQSKHNMTNRGDGSEFENQINKLKKELDESVTTIHHLKLEISNLENQITLVKLEKSGITLQLHETEKRLETEKNWAEQLKNTQKLLMAAVIQLRDDGKVDSSDCIHLLHMVRSSNIFPIDGSKPEN